jgi:hypothetical protein
LQGGTTLAIPQHHGYARHPAVEQGEDDVWSLAPHLRTQPGGEVPVGVFLLIAARRPSEHRSMIALAAWWNISHGLVMAIQTVQAWMHGVHRNFTDVIVFLVIGVVLLALLPAKREVVAPGVA